MCIRDRLTNNPKGPCLILMDRIFSPHSRPTRGCDRTTFRLGLGRGPVAVCAVPVVSWLSPPALINVYLQRRPHESSAQIRYC
eukprot:3929284-Prymnesium_polylepis.1